MNPQGDPARFSSRRFLAATVSYRSYQELKMSLLLVDAWFFLMTLVES